ncbi:MAG TPA: hypothetical protein VMJ32_12005 [Pirellulales bacterium]|nr:hypothetical protein [Pirellulales bacterium]
MSQSSGAPGLLAPVAVAPLSKAPACPPAVLAGPSGSQRAVRVSAYQVDVESSITPSPESTPETVKSVDISVTLDPKHGDSDDPHVDAAENSKQKSAMQESPTAPVDDPSSHHLYVTIAPTLNPAQPPTSEQPNTSNQPTATSTMLPWGPTAPSPEMAAISGRAEEAARRGFSLAERGAMYSARMQFIESLRILAAAMDAQRNTDAHVRALSAGLRAMQEVDDFVPRDEQLETDLNFRLIIDAHHTPVLKEQPWSNITALEAQRMYLSYAQEQLAAAGADQPVASLALLGLGKICTAPAEMHGPRVQIAEAKAVVFHQTALLVEPKNFMAANELGVLLAHFGKLNEARSTLEQAVAMSGGPTEWKNLAAVCDQLGEPAKAADARQQAQVAANRLQTAGYASAGTKYPVQWLDPTAFAATSSLVADNSPTPAAGGPHDTSSTPALSSVMSSNTSASSNSPSDSAAVPVTASKPQAKGGFWPWTK